MKKKNGKAFIGNCWPGDSLYIDFLNPEARKFWADQFAFDKVSHSVTRFSCQNKIVENIWNALITGTESFFPVAAIAV